MKNAHVFVRQWAIPGLSLGTFDAAHHVYAHVYLSTVSFGGLVFRPRPAQ